MNREPEVKTAIYCLPPSYFNHPKHLFCNHYHCRFSYEPWTKLVLIKKAICERNQRWMYFYNFILHKRTEADFSLLVHFLFIDHWATKRNWWGRCSRPNQMKHVLCCRIIVLVVPSWTGNPDLIWSLISVLYVCVHHISLYSLWVEYIDNVPCGFDTASMKANAAH